MGKYDQVVIDEPFTVKTGKNVLDLACCDCGLVHEVDIKIVGKHVQLTFRVNKRKSAACRRHWGIEGGATVEFN